LNYNILHLCCSQEVNPELLHPLHTLHNILVLLKSDSVGRYVLPFLKFTALFISLGLTYCIFWITDFHHHFGRSGGGNKKKKTFVYTTFYFAGITNFLLLYFGREGGIKPSPAAAIVW
jgi:hypothetical protein